MRRISERHTTAPKGPPPGAVRLAPAADSRELWEEAALRRVSVSMVRKLYVEGTKVHVGGGVFETIKLPSYCVGKKRLIPIDGSEVFWARLRNAPPVPKQEARAEGEVAT